METFCEFCFLNKVLFSRRYKMCIDCFALGIVDSKIIKSLFQYSETDEHKTCEICLDATISRGRKTRLCLDCIALALQRAKIFERKEQKTLSVKYVYYDEPESHSLHCFRPRATIRRRYHRCMSCSEGTVGDEREMRICIDCMIYGCIKSGIFEIEDEAVYKPGVPRFAHVS